MRRGFLFRWRLLFAACSCLCGSIATHAEIRVVKANGQPVPGGAYTKSYNVKTGGWDITLSELYAPMADSVFEIRADAAETIDNLLITIDGPPAGSPVIIRMLGEAPGYLRAVHNVLQSGTAETILNKIYVTEDIGSVQIEAIGDLIAGRDILGPIVATTANNTARGITSAQAGRDIRGDLSAEHGRILLVYAQNGTIGTAGQPITIRAKHAIYQIESSEVHAHVNTRVNGGSGGFFALVCDTFSGSIVTEKLILNPWIPLDGLMLIRKQFAGTITLGKSYSNPLQYIQLPPNGLTGQIIINADSAGDGAWSAPVRIGPQGHPSQIVLNQPNYSQTPAILGGGSVGLVPFRLHGAACFPAQGANMLWSPSSQPLVVHLHHYGPVSATGNAPVTIERRPAGTTQTFTALSMNEFAVEVSATNANVLRVAPAAGQPGFAPGYEYRLRPTSQLACAVPAAPQVLWSADYVFTVTVPPCVGDVNSDGIVNVNDLLVVLAFWGPSQPAFPAADITSDGVVNVNDLLAVIGHWGACP